MASTMSIPLTRNSVVSFWSRLDTDLFERFEWYTNSSRVRRYYNGAGRESRGGRDYAILLPDSLDQLLPSGAVVNSLTLSYGNPSGNKIYCFLAESNLIAKTAEAAYNEATYIYEHSSPVTYAPGGGTAALTVAPESETYTAILTYGVILAYGAIDDANKAYVVGNPQIIVTYIDPAKAPEISITAPIDLSNRIASEAMTVSWTYEQEGSSPQTAYLIEKSTDGGISWSTAASATSANAYHTFAADTFSAGTLMLRVTASSQYADSDPVTVRVNMRANPSTSDVSCNGKPQPTVSWTGADQTAYQVRFDDWDSGAQFGTATSLKVPRYYSAGVYPVTVRTQTSNGDWSDWSETLWVELTNVDPGLTTTLTAAQSGAGVLAGWTDAGAAGYILLRDGTAVWAGTETHCRDELVTADAVYVVRMIAPDGYYSDSAAVTVTYRQRCDMLRPLDDDTAGWIRIRWSLAARSRSYDRSVDTTFRHYAGREKPVSISSGAVTRTMRTTAAFKTRAEAEAILELAGRPVVYKDANGGSIFGILNPAGYDSERVFSVDISITEIDWPDNDVEAGIAAMLASVPERFVVVDLTEALASGNIKTIGIVSSSKKWTNTGSPKGAFLEVPDGSAYVNIYMPNNSGYIAYLTSNTYSSGTMPDYCTGKSGRVEMPSGASRLALPSDCKYVYALTKTTGGTSTAPSYVWWEGTYVPAV